jgi:putative FmdB family regulatory protein
MPTYEYQCDACNHNFDEFQSIMAKPLKKCPQCGKQKLRRVFGIGSAILFKGSGFYQTDYRSESYKAGAKADAESNKPASDNGTTGKTDTPAAAPANDGKGESKSTKSKS